MCHLWGRYDPLKAPYLQRFADLETDAQFYFDQHHGKVMTGLPGPTAFARHTQLLPMAPQH